MLTRQLPRLFVCSAFLFGALAGLVACGGGSDVSPEPADAAPGTPDAAPGRPDATPGRSDAGVDTPDAAPGTPDAMPGSPDAGVPPITDPNGCSDLFDQSTFGTWEIEVSPDEMAKLTDEFLNWAEREQQHLDPNPYHPARVRYQGGPWVEDARIRLKGQSSWHETVAFDTNPRMQFTISFNEVDSHARFHHVRKVDLDMPRNDWTFLRQRLAAYYLRKAGLGGPCASSSKVMLNGSYYGLFTTLEKQDKEYLQRLFGDDDEGDLWDGGAEAKTNEESPNWTRIMQFWMVTTASALAAISDLPHSLDEWAAEAMLNDGDGYYGGFHNFYLYDHPTRGYLWLPHDLDATFDWQPTNSSPIFWSRAMEPGLQYLLVMADPTWLQRYIGDLVEARAKFDPVELQGLAATWAAQIHDAAVADPHRPFTIAQHEGAVAYIQQAISARAAYIDEWLDCRAHGGQDVDGDGYDDCHDCDDHDATVHPGAPEQCNALDDDCDGRIDESDGGAPVCPSSGP